MGLLEGQGGLAQGLTDEDIRRASARGSRATPAADRAASQRGASSASSGVATRDDNTGASGRARTATVSDDLAAYCWQAQRDRGDVRGTKRPERQNRHQSNRAHIMGAASPAGFRSSPPEARSPDFAI